MKKFAVIVSVVVFFLFLPVVGEKLTEYSYIDFKRGEAVEYDAFGLPENDDIWINNVAAMAHIHTMGRKDGEYWINMGSFSRTDNHIIHINDISAQIKAGGVYKDLVVEYDKNEIYDFKKIDAKYVSYDYIGEFTVDFNDIKMEDIEALELSVNVTVENDVRVTRDIKYLFYPEEKQSSAVYDYLASV